MGEVLIQIFGSELFDKQVYVKKESLNFQVHVTANPQKSMQ